MKSSSVTHVTNRKCTQNVEKSYINMRAEEILLNEKAKRLTKPKRVYCI